MPLHANHQTLSRHTNTMKCKVSTNDGIHPQLANPLKGFNRYIPPNYDGKRTLNQMAGKPHGLGTRARKVAMGILVVRFEAPMDMSCSACGASIAQGERFNAEKQRVGFYYSTPVWAFSFTCPRCKNPIVIRTDPRNARYIATLGAKEKSSSMDSSLILKAADMGTGSFADIDGSSATALSSRNLANLGSRPSNDAATDAFSLVERNKAYDLVKASREAEILRLYERNIRQWRDSYASSQRLRKKFRLEKHAIERQIYLNNKLKEKNSLFLTPAAELAEDVEIAKLNVYANGNSSNDRLNANICKQKALQKLAMQVDLASDPFASPIIPKRAKKPVKHNAIRASKHNANTPALVSYNSDSDN